MGRGKYETRQYTLVASTIVIGSYKLPAHPHPPNTPTQPVPRCRPPCASTLLPPTCTRTQTAIGVVIIIINVVLLGMLGAVIVRSTIPKARAVVARAVAALPKARALVTRSTHAWSTMCRQLLAGAAVPRGLLRRRWWWRAASPRGTPTAAACQQGAVSAVGLDGPRGCIEASVPKEAPRL